MSQLLLFAFDLHHCMYSVYKTFNTPFLLFLSRQSLTTALRIALRTPFYKIAIFDKNYSITSFLLRQLSYRLVWEVICSPTYFIEHLNAVLEMLIHN